jgi:hypothetical protein
MYLSKARKETCRCGGYGRETHDENYKARYGNFIMAPCRMMERKLKHGALASNPWAFVISNQ